ncbi:MAG: TetR/AcrR family transcriptional regulator [Acidimicrobiales bacterium]
MDAAVVTLKKKGFVGASARAIAEEAGATQGLIFYHFGTVSNLLLAALDSVSTMRLEAYGTLLSKTNSPGDLVDVATEIFRTDLDAGYMSVLAEMIAGASASSELGPEVAARIEPWREFAKSAIEKSIGDTPFGSMLPAGELAYAVVALFLGLELLSHLDGNREPALDLFALAKQLTGLMEALSNVRQTGETS